MKSLRIFGIVFLAIFFCVTLFSLNTHAQVRSTPVTVVNEPTVGISPNANTVKVEGGTPYLLTANAIITQGASNGSSSPVAITATTDLETYSIICTTFYDQTIRPFIVIDLPPPTTPNQFVIYPYVPHQMNRGDQHFWQSTTSAKITIPAGATITFYAQRDVSDPNTAATCSFNVSGRLPN
jgi:hypothetical protein